MQNWTEPAFASRCSDKLFLTPLVVGTLAYSAGALIHRASQHRAPEAAHLIGAVPGALQLITTPFRAFMAVAFTGAELSGDLHSQMINRIYSQHWLFSGTFATWVMVTINVTFCAFIFLLGVSIASGSLRKDEKTLLLAVVGRGLLAPIGALLPRITSGVRFVQTLLSLVAFCAALVIFVAFLERSREQPS